MTTAPMRMPLPEAGEPIELILKLPGESCNINCSYCYEKRQATKSDGFIGPDVIAGLAAALGTRPVSIGLHGGEPLLIGLTRMRSLLALTSRSLRVTDFKLQTNGSLLNKAYIELFRAGPAPVTVGLSHDGPADLSAYRIDRRGRPDVARSDRALQLLADSGLNFGVICVVSQANLSCPEQLIDFFSGFAGLATVNFVPCFDHSVMSRETTGRSGALIRALNPDRRGLPGWAITPLAFLEFLCRAWQRWEQRPNFAIEPFVSIIRKLAGRRPESCDFTPQKCAHVYTVYPDGRVTSCDEFESRLADLGTRVGAASAAWPSASAFYGLSDTAARHLAKCDGCSHRATCGGGCIATRERYHGSQYYEEYCLYKKRIIDFVDVRLRELEDVLE